jgi:hypothetical protein
MSVRTTGRSSVVPSSVSSTNASAKGYASATPAVEGSYPSAAINFAAGPEYTRSSTNGETTTTVVSASASATPSTASIGPMLVTGFDGPTTTGSASADRTASVAAASPRNSTDSTVGSPFRATQNSWKCITPSGVCISVASGSLLIGSTRQGTPSASASRPVTSVRLWPSSSNPVRVRCIARSRSPMSMNSATPEKRRQRASLRPPVCAVSSRYRGPSSSPAASASCCSSVCVSVVSSSIPHQVSRSSIPPPRNSTVSISGQTSRPPNSTSSPVLPTTVTSAGGKTDSLPASSFGVPVPPARNVTIPVTVAGRY